MNTTPQSRATVGTPVADNPNAGKARVWLTDFVHVQIAKVAPR